MTSKPWLHQRPCFGGGFRPTTGRGHFPELGLHEPYLEWNPTLGRFARWDFDDFCPAVPPFQAADDDAERAPWISTALGEVGVAEVAGKHKANPRILDYFKASRYRGTDDSGARNAWCGSFVAWVMKQNGITPVAKGFRARAWASFGQKLDAPAYGAIGIKSRKGGGHVAFILGRSEDGEKYYMLGGNQRDAVRISEYPSGVWTAFVFPPGHDPGSAGLPIYQGDSSTAGQEH